MVPDHNFHGRPGQPLGVRAPSGRPLSAAHITESGAVFSTPGARGVGPGGPPAHITHSGAVFSTPGGMGVAPVGPPPRTCAATYGSVSGLASGFRPAQPTRAPDGVGMFVGGLLGGAGGVGDAGGGSGMGSGGVDDEVERAYQQTLIQLRAAYQGSRARPCLTCSDVGLV